MADQQRLVYSGLVRLNGDDPQRTEIWASPNVAVAFAGSTPVGVLRSLALGWTTDRRLRLTGLDPDGVPTVWEATDPERVSTRWPNARVSWPDGRVSIGATVAGSQHGVRISVAGEVTDLPAARLQAVGAQRWIVDGDVRILASDGRGCGCGGRR